MSQNDQNIDAVGLDCEDVNNIDDKSKSITGEIESEEGQHSSTPAQSARMRHNQSNSEQYFKIKQGAT